MNSRFLQDVELNRCRHTPWKEDVIFCVYTIDDCNGVRSDEIKEMRESQINYYQNVIGGVPRVFSLLFNGNLKEYYD